MSDDQMNPEKLEAIKQLLQADPQVVFMDCAAASEFDAQNLGVVCSIYARLKSGHGI